MSWCVRVFLMQQSVCVVEVSDEIEILTLELRVQPLEETQEEVKVA